jgi:hypothetical protein
MTVRTCACAVGYCCIEALRIPGGPPLPQWPAALEDVLLVRGRLFGIAKFVLACEQGFARDDQREDESLQPALVQSRVLRLRVVGEVARLCEVRAPVVARGVSAIEAPIEAALGDVVLRVRTAPVHAPEFQGVFCSRAYTRFQGRF